MTNIKEGGKYVAKRIFTGTNKTGPWEIVVVQSEGRRQPKIGISVLNPPSGIGLNGAFMIDRIYSVSVRNYQTADGEWHSGGAVTVKAEISAISDMLEQVKPKKKKDENDIFETNTQFPSLEDLLR